MADDNGGKYYKTGEDIVTQFTHVDRRTEEEIEEQMAKFVQVDHASVLKLNIKDQNKIKQKLTSVGHWASSSGKDDSPCLATRLASDMKAIRDAGVDRVLLLRFFELTKDIFDNCMAFMNKTKSLPTPEGVLILQSNSISGSCSSVNVKSLSDIELTNLEAVYKMQTHFLAHPVRVVFDSNHLMTLPYRTAPLYQKNQALQDAFKTYQAGVISARNAFVQEFGHTQHVSRLLLAPVLLAKQIPNRRKWTMWRETMLMLGQNLIVYRIEWGGAEVCPIYGHFEPQYIGYKRGNVDWFICNTTNDSQVWIPDLTIYQVGLFGFLQGLASKYRFDLAGYKKTIVESYNETTASPTVVVVVDKLVESVNNLSIGPQKKAEAP